ncbi:MAG TPA: ester cyclase [Ignavibacteriaceae bacterium]|nr:ester cyclase [Ignavibacteriaceae bacterium]
MKQSIIKTALLFFVVMFVITTGCQQQKDYSKELKPLFDKYMEAWRTGNVDGLEEIFDSKFVRHSDKGSSANNLEEMKKVITEFKNSFPDAKLISEEEIFTENKFSGRWSFTATSNGKPVSQWGINIIHFKDGKMVEEWDSFDNASFMEQVGYTITEPADMKQ